MLRHSVKYSNTKGAVIYGEDANIVTPWYDIRQMHMYGIYHMAYTTHMQLYGIYYMLY